MTSSAQAAGSGLESSHPSTPVPLPLGACRVRKEVAHPQADAGMGNVEARRSAWAPVGRMSTVLIWRMVQRSFTRPLAPVAAISTREPEPGVALMWIRRPAKHNGVEVIWRLWSYIPSNFIRGS